MIGDPKSKKREDSPIAKSAKGRAPSSPFVVAIFTILVWLIPFPVRVVGQNLDKPVMNVDDEVTAFAYAPDGRIVFSVRRMFKTKKYDMQRDDIFHCGVEREAAKNFGGTEIHARG